jgi:tetratricopeptide (TPR) repeat protein
VEDIEGVAATLSNLGDALVSEGKLEEGRKLLLESVPNYQAIEDKDGLARVLNDLGDLSKQKGDLKSAENSYQQAKSTAEGIDDKSLIAYVYSGLGDILAERANLDAARSSYEQSLKLRNEAGESLTAAETQVSLARLSIEQGHPAEAETAARKCEEQFHHEQQADDELLASVVLAQSLLAQSKGADAKAEVARSAPLASKNQNRFAGLRFSLVSARVVLASDQPGLSQPQLEQVLKDARRYGFVEIEWETLLSLAELKKKSGQVAAAKTQLVLIAKAAHAKGFDLIAHKATALL